MFIFENFDWLSQKFNPTVQSFKKYTNKTKLLYIIFEMNNSRFETWFEKKGLKKRFSDTVEPQLSELIGTASTSDIGNLG